MGRSPEVEFNDEHVLPRWLLKKHNLFDQAINLPNLTALKYGQYKTPCCKPCNSYLGRTTEQPIRNALSGGFATLDAHVRTHGTGCLFRWLSLIYLKTHLKDLALRLDRTGKFLGNIGDDHEWALLHHVHCIVRSELVGANLAPTAFGSLIIISVNAEGFADSYFDFADNHLGRTVLLGTGDVGVVAVMDDSCGVFSV